MIPLSPKLTFGLAGVTIAQACVLLAMVPEPGPPTLWEMGYFGVLYGTLFSLATLGAVWAAWGPLPLLARWPLSALLPVAAAVIISAINGPDGSRVEFLVMISLALLAQWLLAQLPLWGLRLARGVRLRRADELRGVPGEHQFGIRQLLILTAMVAVALGVGRAVVALTDIDSERGVAVIFGFLVLCNLIATLPLVVAALLPRRALVATLIGLGFVAVVTMCEIPAFALVRPNGGPPDEHLIFWVMNFVQAGWVVGILSLLRLGSYRLAAASEVNGEPA